MDFYHDVGVLLYPDNASILGRKQSYPTVDTNNRTKDRISTSGVPLIDGSAQFHNLVEEGAHEPVPVPNDAFSMQNSHQTIEAAEINSSWVGALLHVVRVGPNDEASQMLKPGANIVKRVCATTTCLEYNKENSQYDKEGRKGSRQCGTCKGP
jgi:hypothetical protein